MMSEPEPTEVIPTSRPPSAPTRMVGNGRTTTAPPRLGFRPLALRRTCTHRRKAYVAAARKNTVDAPPRITPAPRGGPKKSKRHGAAQEQNGDPQVCRPPPPVHCSA